MLMLIQNGCLQIIAIISYVGWLCKVSLHLKFVLSEALGLGALGSEVTVGVHDDLFEHEDGEKQTTDVDEYFVNKCSPSHSQITIEATECETLLDERLLVVLLILFIFSNDNASGRIFENSVEIDDCD